MNAIIMTTTYYDINIIFFVSCLIKRNDTNLIRLFTSVYFFASVWIPYIYVHIYIHIPILILLNYDSSSPLLDKGLSHGGMPLILVFCSPDTSQPVQVGTLYTTFA